MTRDKFNEIINHLWYYHDVLADMYPDFDYPSYGGLKSKMNDQSPEAVDAMQEIWENLIEGDYKTRSEFSKMYEGALFRIGEVIV